MNSEVELISLVSKSKETKTYHSIEIYDSSHSKFHCIPYGQQHFQYLTNYFADVLDALFDTNIYRVRTRNEILSDLQQINAENVIAAKFFNDIIHECLDELQHHLEGEIEKFYRSIITKVVAALLLLFIISASLWPGFMRDDSNMNYTFFLIFASIVGGGLTLSGTIVCIRSGTINLFYKTSLDTLRTDLKNIKELIAIFSEHKDSPNLLSLNEPALETLKPILLRSFTEDKQLFWDLSTSIRMKLNPAVLAVITAQSDAQFSMLERLTAHHLKRRTHHPTSEDRQVEKYDDVEVKEDISDNERPSVV